MASRIGMADPHGSNSRRVMEQIQHLSHRFLYGSKSSDPHQSNLEYCLLQSALILDRSRLCFTRNDLHEQHWQQLCYFRYFIAFRGPVLRVALLRSFFGVFCVPCSRYVILWLYPVLQYTTLWCSGRVQVALARIRDGRDVWRSGLDAPASENSGLRATREKV